MNATSSFEHLAALTDAGVALHDVLGGIMLAVLVVAGVLLSRHQHRWLGRRSLEPETNVDRKFGRIQLWAVYWVVVAVTIGFFFVMPRGTSQKAQLQPAESSAP